MTTPPRAEPVVDPGRGRVFQHCAYCALIRLCSFYGRRWLCDDCAKESGLR